MRPIFILPALFFLTQCQKISVRLPPPQDKDHPVVKTCIDTTSCKVSLTWNPSMRGLSDGTKTSKGIQYSIHIGSTPQIYERTEQGNESPTATITGFGFGTYYIVVQAHYNGQSSSYSNEVAVTFTPEKMQLTDTLLLDTTAK